MACIFYGILILPKIPAAFSGCDWDGLEDHLERIMDLNLFNIKFGEGHRFEPWYSPYAILPSSFNAYETRFL